MLIWFAETTLIASILAAVALLGGRWRRIGPVGRHALWLVVLVKLVAPPIVYWPRPPILPSVEARVTERPGPSSGPEAITPRLTLGEDAKAEGVSLISPAVPMPAPSSVSPLKAGASIGPIPLDLAAIRRAILIAWAAATTAIVLACSCRVARFRRHLKGALPPPLWFEEEARLVARSLGVRVPEILVIPATTSPMLWCLGRSGCSCPVGSSRPWEWNPGGASWLTSWPTSVAGTTGSGDWNCWPGSSGGGTPCTGSRGGGSRRRPSSRATSGPSAPSPKDASFMPRRS